MIKELREIQKVTSNAKLLVDNYSDMTVQAIYSEYRMLEAEYEIARRNASSAIQGRSGDTQELVEAIVESRRVMNQAEDSLELNYNRISTNL
jgi:hypothetical protein